MNAVHILNIVLLFFFSSQTVVLSLDCRSDIFFKNPSLPGPSIKLVLSVKYTRMTVFKVYVSILSRIPSYQVRLSQDFISLLAPWIPCTVHVILS